MISKIKRYKNKEFFNSNSYLIALENHDVILIDPVLNSGKCNLYEDLCNLNLNTKVHVFITHEHFDHFYGINRVLNNKGYILYITDPLLKSACDPKHNLSFYYNCSYSLSPCNFVFYEFSDDIVKIQDLDLKIHFTPGHSRYSNCILIGNYLFGGDTIIMKEYITSKLPGGSKENLKRSINNLIKLFKNDNLKVYPGHGEPFNFNDFFENL